MLIDYHYFIIIIYFPPPVSHRNCFSVNQCSPFILEVVRSIWCELLPGWNGFVPGWNEFVPGFSGIYIKFQKNNFFVFKDREVILSEINSHNCSRIFPRGLHIKFQKTLVRIHSIPARIHSILEQTRTKWNESLPKQRDYTDEGSRST